jgi:hypothetical protein
LTDTHEFLIIVSFYFYIAVFLSYFVLDFVVGEDAGGVGDRDDDCFFCFVGAVECDLIGIERLFHPFFPDYGLIYGHHCSPSIVYNILLCFFPRLLYHYSI